MENQDEKAKKPDGENLRWNDLKKEFTTYTITNPGSTWSAIYLTGFFISAAITTTLTEIFSYEINDPETARYLLSALIQGQAALIAIIVSLSLVAIQIISSNYAPRITDILKRYPNLWLLLGFYALSIAICSFTLGSIKGSELLISHQIVYSINFCLIFSLILLPLMMLYIRHTMFLLNIDTIFELTAQEIDSDFVMEGRNYQIKQKEKQELSLVTYFDIIHSSIMKYDMTTTIYGLNCIRERIQKIISTKCDEEISFKLSERLSKEFVRALKLSIQRDDEEASQAIFLHLNIFTNFLLEKPYQRSLIPILKNLQKIRKIVEEKRDLTPEFWKILNNIRDKHFQDPDVEELIIDLYEKSVT